MALPLLLLSLCACCWFTAGGVAAVAIVAIVVVAVDVVGGINAVVGVVAAHVDGVVLVLW